MKIGLYFGSFNPVHIGHMAIANYFMEFTDIEQLWFVISPHNPLKEKRSLLNDYSRLELVELAIDDDPRFRSCDIEFNMPQPSYTIDTLTYLKEKYPKHDFALIMGSDGLKNFDKWKNQKEIFENYERYVYLRKPDTSDIILLHKNIKVVDAPEIEISSTFIRRAILKGMDMRFFLPHKVYEHIDKSGYYKE